MGGSSNSSSGGMKVSGGSGAYLPLYHTKVDATVTGPLADVSVVQVFKNNTKEKLEAVYSFPLAQDGAVYSFEFHLDKRIVKGVIKEKEEAKADYAKAKEQGITASLLDQDKENLFTMSLANIKPGEKIEVHMRYQEKIPYDDGEFRFVFPLVKNDAYANNESSSSKDKEQQKLNDVTIVVHVKAGVAIHPPRSLVHDVSVTKSSSPSSSSSSSASEEGADVYEIQLNKKEKYPNRDFVIAYSVVDRGVSPMVYLQRESASHDGTFLVVLNPPDEADTLKTQRAPADFVFLLDRSASMRGGSLEQAQNALKFLLEGLNENDGVQVISYDHEIESYNNSNEFSSANGDALATILAYVAQLTPRGGTELELAVYAALTSIKQREGREKAICLITDGAIADHTRAMQLCDDIVKQEHTRLFILGVGPSVDRLLVSRMSSKGMGVSEVLLPGEKEPVQQTCARFRKRLLQNGPLINNINLSWKGAGFKVHSIFPSPIPSLFSGQPLQLLGRFSTSSSSEGTDNNNNNNILPSTLTITGDLVDGSDFTISKDVSIPLGPYEGYGSAVERSWARCKIDNLTEAIDAKDTTPDDKETFKYEVISLSFRQTLASKYTSFVAEECQEPKEEEDNYVAITLRDERTDKEAHITDLRLRDKGASVVLRAAVFFDRPARRVRVRIGDKELNLKTEDKLIAFMPSGVRACNAIVTSGEPTPAPLPPPPEFPQFEGFEFIEEDKEEEEGDIDFGASEFVGEMDDSDDGDDGDDGDADEIMIDAEFSRPPPPSRPPMMGARAPPALAMAPPVPPPAVGGAPVPPPSFGGAAPPTKGPAPPRAAAAPAPKMSLARRSSPDTSSMEPAFMDESTSSSAVSSILSARVIADMEDGGGGGSVEKSKKKKSVSRDSEIARSMEYEEEEREERKMAADVEPEPEPEKNVHMRLDRKEKSAGTSILSKVKSLFGGGKGESSSKPSPTPPPSSTSTPPPPPITTASSSSSSSSAPPAKPAPYRTGSANLKVVKRSPSAVMPAKPFLRRDTPSFLVEVSKQVADVPTVTSSGESEPYPKDVLEWALQKPGIGQVDLAFVIDETGSMGSWINEVQKEVLRIIKDIQAHPMCKDVRIGLVGYRDHPPQDDMVARVMPFTSESGTIQASVKQMRASGGGDGPECMTDGMYEAVNLDWRPSAAKAVIVITDAPPHGLPGSHGDGFPNGCPCGRHWYTQAASLREMGVTCYTVGCGLYGEVMLVYKAIAQITRGVYVPLTRTSLLVPLIIGAAEVEIDRQRVAEVVLDEIISRKKEFDELFASSPSSSSSSSNNNNNNDNNGNDNDNGNDKEDTFVAMLMKGMLRKNLKLKVRELSINKAGRMSVSFRPATEDDIRLALADLRRGEKINYY